MRRLLALTLACVTLAQGVPAVAAPASRPAGSWSAAPIALTGTDFGAAVARLASSGGGDVGSSGPARRDDPTRDPYVDFVGNSFHDRCEGTEAFDVKKLSIIDDGANKVTLLWGTCPGVTAPTGTTDAIAFIIDDGDPAQGGTYVGPNLVVIQHTRSAAFEVFDTNGSADESRWTRIQQGVGTVSAVGPDRGGPRSVGEISVDAVDAQFPLRYQVAAVTTRGSVVGDIVPEDDMPPIAFPFSCDYFELRSARVTTTGAAGTDPAAADSTARAAATVGADRARSLVRSSGARVHARVGGRSWQATPVSDVELARLNALPGIRAERPAAFQAFADPEPTSWAVAQTHLDQAWEVIPRGQAMIALLDQGVDGGRSDLVGHVGPGFNAFTGEAFSTGVDSALGIHGTSVAGIIAGTRDNGREVAGVNDGATILPVLVFDHANCADDTTIAAGLDWAVEQGAQVINLSLGGPQDTPTLRQAIRRASAAGLLIIAATGNDEGSGRANYPAAYPEVIGVGATGPSREGPVVATYSQSIGTELVAPGGLNTGERDTDFAVLAEWEGIAFEAGTSFAAPFVAALASLWMAAHPSASASEARAALSDASTDLPGTTRDGAGLLDAFSLLGDATPPPAGGDVTPAPTVDGDPATTHRMDTNDAVIASLKTSQTRHPEGGAGVAVLARRDAFADALSAAALTADGPLLFTDSTTLDPRVGRELTRVVAPEGTIYLLGGTAAISAGIEAEVRRDHPAAKVVRLHGSNRFETSRAIVRETVARHGVAGHLLLARATGPASDPNGTAAWADAIAAGAYAASRRIPLLVVRTEGLGPTDLEVIREVTRQDAIVTLLGGTSALSADVLEAARSVRSTRRVRGGDRDATAANIALTLWGVNPTGPRTYVVLNTHVASGWFLGLASAGYAADIGAPILTTDTAVVPAATAGVVARCGAPQIELWLAGSTQVIGSAVAAELERLDGRAC